MIQHFRSGKLPAVLTLILLTLLVLDLFILEKKRVADIIDNGTIDVTYDKSEGAEDKYYLITKTRKHIKVSRQLFNEILIDDTVYISTTPLFSRPARLSWCHESNCYIQNINPFNMGYFSDILLAVLLGVSLLRLLNLQKLDAAIDFVTLVVAAGIMAYYLNT